MSYSFRRFIEENFEAELKNAAAEYIAYDNTRGIPVQMLPDAQNAKN